MNKENFENYLKFGLGAVIIGVAGFAALFLIKSIVVLAIVSFGAIFLYNSIPVFAQWAAQMKIKGYKAIAAANPVEELQSIYMQKHKAIETASTAITAFAKETKDYKSKLDEFVARRPEKAESFRATYTAMSKVLDIQRNKLANSHAALKNFESVIIEAEDIWSMTQAAMKANKAMKNFDAPDPLTEIRQRTAYDSILSSLNEVTAELETAVHLDYNQMIQIEHAPQVQTITLDMTSPVKMKA